MAALMLQAGASDMLRKLLERQRACICLQALDSKLAGLTAGVQQALNKASTNLRGSVASFLSEMGDKPDWRTHPERFTFWAARWLTLSSTEKLHVCLLRCVLQ
jgi:hypothetical protein